MPRDPYRDYNDAARAAYRGLAAFGDVRTPFDELLIGEFSPLFELDSANGLSTLRDRATVTNSGAVSSVPGEIKLSTGTTASSTAQLDTAEKGRYQPGILGSSGAAIREENLSANGVIQVGYFDDENGFWIEKHGDGTYYAGHRVGGSDKPLVPQSEWNGTDVDLNLDATTVFRFPYLCYYGGPLMFDVIDVDSNGGVARRRMHYITPVAGEPILEESKLPVRVRIDNGGDAADNVVYVGGRHYGVYGRYDPNRRETAERRINTSISTSLKPIVSFRKKANYADRAKSIKISGLAVTADANAIIEVHLNPGGLTDGNFGSVTNIPDSETAVESNILDTTMTAGQVLDRTLVSGGSGNRSNLSGIRRLGLDIPDDATITLAMRTESGTGVASAVFTVQEEW